VSSHCHCVQEASSSSGAGFRRVNWTLLASEGLAGLSNTHTRAHTRAHTLLLDQPDKGGPAKHVHLLRHRYAIATIQPCIILAASVKRMKTTMRLKRRRRRMACCTVGRSPSPGPSTVRLVCGSTHTGRNPKPNGSLLFIGPRGCILYPFHSWHGVRIGIGMVWYLPSVLC
jgi:hypothetical protein